MKQTSKQLFNSSLNFGSMRTGVLIDNQWSVHKSQWGLIKVWPQVYFLVLHAIVFAKTVLHRHVHRKASSACLYICINIYQVHLKFTLANSTMICIKVNERCFFFSPRRYNMEFQPDIQEDWAKNEPRVWIDWYKPSNTFQKCAQICLAHGSLFLMV